MTNNNQDDFLDEQPEKSKSQVKRELLELQDLGKVLIDLSDKQLEKIPLEDALRKQVIAAKTMQRGALKRQTQYIGKLLRKADTESINKALSVVQNTSVEQNAHFHRLEKLRDGLIENKADVFEQLVTLHPEVDRQHIRALIRNAQKEKEQNKPPAATRELFKYLRSVFESKE